MNRRLVFFLLSAGLGCGLIGGFLMHRQGWYPHQAMASVLHRLGLSRSAPDYTSWSIGVYEGPSPVDLSEPVGVKNPVLTGKQVGDMDAQFVADPFLLAKDDRFYMFFEVLNRDTMQGDISYAESGDGLHWEYKQRVLDEPFHLSYPYVFEWEGECYMIPESHSDLSVRLYKATSFPSEWKYERSLLSGYHYVDPSILRYDNTWWLFLSTQENDHLNVYYADELLGEWTPHPMNPVVKNNARHSRPGGRISFFDGHIYRFSQDCSEEYGKRIFAFEITELTKLTFSEQLVAKDPVVGPGGDGWNGGGMHHVSPVEIKGRWIGAVDGRSR